MGNHWTRRGLILGLVVALLLTFGTGQGMGDQAAMEEGISRIEAIVQAIYNPYVEPPKGELVELSKSVDNLNRNFESQFGLFSFSDLESTIDSVESSIRELSSDVGQLGSRIPDDLSSLIKDLRSRIDDIAWEMDSLSQEISSISSSTESLRSEIERLPWEISSEVSTELASEFGEIKSLIRDYCGS